MDESDLQTLSMLCRLCLKKDDLTTEIFQQKFKGKELLQQLFDLYQIKVESNEFSPSKICHRCLYMTLAFTGFRENVKRCDAKLKENCNSLNKKTLNESTEFSDIMNLNGSGSLQHFVPDGNYTITVVDPNQQYESSDDDFLMESDCDFQVNSESNDFEPEASQNPSTTNTLRKEHVNSSKASDSFISIGRTEALNECKNTFHCQYCDMAFTVQVECVEHEARHDAANPFTCNFCPFRTMNRQVLIHHIKDTHHNERPYVCSLCNKGFCRRSDLKKHTIVHTGVRPYTCPVCGKSFSRNTNLTKHMRIHSGVKPHVCQKCPRSFTTLTEMLHHQKIHTVVKNYKCARCTASFARKDKFLLHERTHCKQKMEVNANSQEKNELDELVEKRDIDYIGLNSVITHTQKFGFVNEKYDQNKSSSPRKIETFIDQSSLLRERPLHQDKLVKSKHRSKQFYRREKLSRYENELHPQKFKNESSSVTFSKKDALNVHRQANEMQNILAKHISNPENVQSFEQIVPKLSLGFYNEIRPEEGNK